MAALFVLGDRPEWFDRARCMGMDVEVFYGDSDDQQIHGSHRPYLLPEQVRHAKAVCGECPVRIDCLSWALDNDEEHGIWGGMTQYERRKFYKRMA